jgi:hypothetical protein
MFPTCSEILEVIRGLGYARLSVQPVAVETTTIEEAAPAAEDSETVLS